MYYQHKITNYSLQQLSMKDHMEENPDPLPYMVRSTRHGVSRRDVVGATCRVAKPTISSVLCFK